MVASLVVVLHSVLVVAGLAAKHNFAFRVCFAPNMDWLALKQRFTEKTVGASFLSIGTLSLAVDPFTSRFEHPFM